MDRLIPLFNRVQLGLDQPSDLIARFPELESAILAGDITISPSDLLSILDRPSPNSIASSLARLQCSSASDKAALLHRATHTPTALSSDEVELLRHRFWPSKEYDDCFKVYAKALGKFVKETSEEYVNITILRLRKVREELAGEEEKAFDAATSEWLRRRRLARNIPTGYWGYPVYYEPNAEADNEHYQSRLSGSLQWARGASTVARDMDKQANWMLFNMDWPAGGSDKDKRGLFERLRRDFQMARDALPEGILRNVFLFLDRDCVRTVWDESGGGKVCDDMWVWAVDPEYRDGSQGTQETAPEQEEATYPGYMRVRLQQLVNNFYTARRPGNGNNVVPMQTLWACAQQSRQGLFVSVREEDFQKWTPLRDVGSCLKDGE